MTTNPLFLFLLLQLLRTFLLVRGSSDFDVTLHGDGLSHDSLGRNRANHAEYFDEEDFTANTFATSILRSFQYDSSRLSNDETPSLAYAESITVPTVPIFDVESKGDSDLNVPVAICAPLSAWRTRTDAIPLLTVHPEPCVSALTVQIIPVPNYAARDMLIATSLEFYRIKEYIFAWFRLVAIVNFIALLIIIFGSIFFGN